MVYVTLRTLLLTKIKFGKEIEYKLSHKIFLLEYLALLYERNF